MENIELDDRFHDSMINQVVENTERDTLEFIINYPVDWENNVFKIKRLVFYDVLNYSVIEIPFATSPCILSMNQLGEIHHEAGTGRNKIKYSRKGLEIQTNAGVRRLEFERFELLEK